MAQTAVEWLIEQTRNPEWHSLKRGDIIEQAKEMEKEQIIEAGNSCALKQHLHNDRINKMSESEIRQFAEQDCLTFGEEYYKETFKNK